jgi:hypothetical protein
VRVAIATVFDGYSAMAELKPIIAWFEDGGTLQLADDAPAAEVLAQVNAVNGLERALGMMGLVPKPATGAKGHPAAPFRASALDFILEGLASLKKITRTDEGRFQAPSAERKPRNPDRERAIEQLMDDEGVPAGGKKKKYYN